MTGHISEGDTTILCGWGPGCAGRQELRGDNEPSLGKGRNQRVVQIGEKGREGGERKEKRKEGREKRAEGDL